MWQVLKKDAGGEGSSFISYSWWGGGQQSLTWLGAVGLTWVVPVIIWLLLEFCDGSH